MLTDAGTTEKKAPSKKPKGKPRKRPMEVQHGTQGAKRMLRRGVHGAKNWVLEPDEDGSHRTVGSKAFRAAVTLLPGWIILGAFTGGSKDGGGQTSFLQAFFMATLATLIGLAVFSSRERRLGREEPWAEAEGQEKAPEKAPEGGGAENPENAERPTEIPENPQVREVTTSEQVVTQGDNPDEKDHFEHPEAQVVTEAVTQAVTQPLPTTHQDEVFDQVSDQVTTPEEVVTEVVTEAVTQPEMEIAHHPIPDIPQEGDQEEPLEGGHPDVEVVTQAPEEPSNPQVSSLVEVVTQKSDEAPKVSLEKAPEGESVPPPPEVVTEAVTPVVIRGTQEGLFPQVKKDEGVVTPVVTQAVTPPSHAKAGPYEPTALPLSDDWWAISPDLPEVKPVQTEPTAETAPEAEPETPLEATEPEPVEVEEDVAVEQEAEPVETPEERPEPPVDAGWAEADEEPEGRIENADGERPREVLAYLALDRSEGLTKDAKEKIRQDAMAWVQRECRSGRLSHRGAAKALAVSKTTITNWLNDDPWSVAEQDEGE